MLRFQPHDNLTIGYVITAAGADVERLLGKLSTTYSVCWSCLVITLILCEDATLAVTIQLAGIHQELCEFEERNGDIEKSSNDFTYHRVSKGVTDGQTSRSPNSDLRSEHFCGSMCVTTRSNSSVLIDNRRC